MSLVYVYPFEMIIRNSSWALLKDVDVAIYAHMGLPRWR